MNLLEKKLKSYKRGYHIMLLLETILEVIPQYIIAHPNSRVINARVLEAEARHGGKSPFSRKGVR